MSAPMPRLAVILAGVWFALALPAPVRAQYAAPAPGEGPAPSRIEIGAGWVWAGSSDLGGQTANLVPNLGGSPFVLFDASASFGTPLGGAIRFGYRLAPWLIAGVVGEASRGDVMVDIGRDAEGAPATRFAGETFSQMTIQGRFDVLMPRFRFWGARVTPHVAASAGVLRQWHEGNVLIESGQIYEAGGGVRVVLANRRTSRLSTLGILAEVRLSRVHGGFHWGRETRTAPAATVEFYSGWGR